MTEERQEGPAGRMNLEKACEALENERKRAEDCLTRLKYMQADLENLKKRYDRQIEDVKKYSNERLVTELLDVVDELELAIESSRSADEAETLVQGVEMTLKKLKKVLEKEGISPIRCAGEPFDPLKHSAMARMEKEGVEGCMITEEIRKGYVMGEKVIRPSIVKVVVKPSKSSEMNSNE